MAQAGAVWAACGAAQLRLERSRSGAQPACRYLAGHPRCAVGLRVGDQLVLCRELRGRREPRDAEPGVHAAAVQLSAQRRGQRRPQRGLQAHHLPGPPGQGLLGQAEQQLLRFLRTQLPRLGRQHQGQLLEQVVPGPGRVLVRDQDEGLGQRPRLGLARGRSARRPATALLARLRLRAACVRHRRGDTGQFTAERGVPPSGQRVPVHRARVLALA